MRERGRCEWEGCEGVRRGGKLSQDDRYRPENERNSANLLDREDILKLFCT